MDVTNRMENLIIFKVLMGYFVLGNYIVT